MMQEYKDRDNILLELGFKDYTEYLKSPLWEKIRAEKLTGWGKCYCCEKNRATQLHHTDYSRAVLSGTDLMALMPVCGVCHHEAEYTDKNEKRPLAEANAILFWRDSGDLSKKPAPYSKNTFKKSKRVAKPPRKAKLSKAEKRAKLAKLHAAQPHCAACGNYPAHKEKHSAVRACAMVFSPSLNAFSVTAPLNSARMSALFAFDALVNSSPSTLRLHLIYHHKRPLREYRA